MRKFIALPLILLMFLSGCGSASGSSEECEEIEITEQNLFDYFEWETQQTDSSGGDDSTEVTVNHYLNLKDDYADKVEDSSVVVRVIYDSTRSENDEELQSWPITAIVGIPSDEPVYSEVLGEESTIPSEVEVTFAEGSLELKKAGA